VETSKSWYLSKALWTGVVTVLLGLYELLRGNLFPGWPNIPDYVISILGVLGITFRATAKTTLTK